MVTKETEDKKELKGICFTVFQRQLFLLCAEALPMFVLLAFLLGCWCPVLHTPIHTCMLLGVSPAGLPATPISGCLSRRGDSPTLGSSPSSYLQATEFCCTGQTPKHSGSIWLQAQLDSGSQTMPGSHCPIPGTFLCAVFSLRQALSFWGSRWP